MDFEEIQEADVISLLKRIDILNEALIVYEEKMTECDKKADEYEDEAADYHKLANQMRDEAGEHEEYMAELSGEIEDIKERLEEFDSIPKGYSDNKTLDLFKKE